MSQEQVWFYHNELSYTHCSLQTTTVILFLKIWEELKQHQFVIEVMNQLYVLCLNSYAFCMNCTQVNV